MGRHRRRARRDREGSHRERSALVPHGGALRPLQEIMRAARAGWSLALLLVICAAGPAAAEYTGPIIDAHSHVPNAAAIDAYVGAMKKHNITKVVLLGVGGVQKDDVAWIAAAARKYPGV